MWYADTYDPIRAGSIDGTATTPHDAAIIRANEARYNPPKHSHTDPSKTIFAGRLNDNTSESTLRRFFEKYGPVDDLCLIRNNVTGISRGYAFITYKTAHSAREAYENAHRTILDEHVLLVDYERNRLMPGWVPRRLGGGFGGKKESGQLRFGARDRPFRRPMNKQDMIIRSNQRYHDSWRMTHSDSNIQRSQTSYSQSVARDQRSKERVHTRDRTAISERNRIRDRERDRSRDQDRNNDRDLYQERHKNRHHERDRDRDRDRHPARPRDGERRRRPNEDFQNHTRRRP